MTREEKHFSEVCHQSLQKKKYVVATGTINYRFIIPHRLVNVLINITAKKLYPLISGH